MPLKMPTTDEGKLNMTPMIDIVFNLVTFFMLTLDMSKKELAALDLPRANSGIEDKPDVIDSRDPKAKAENTRFVINLLGKGEIMMKGETYPLSGASPEEQKKSLDKLREKLRTLTRDPMLRNPDGSSKVIVLVRGDRTTKWQYVQWVMQVCAENKIYKINFGVEHPPKEQ